jgi:Domain of unknown function (DUF3291)
MSAYELAQLNIGIIRGPMDSPVMAEFAANLERINALADAAAGFGRRRVRVRSSSPSPFRCGD